MSTEMIVRVRSIRRHAGITVLMAYAILGVSPCTTSAVTVTVTVNPDGTFSPNPVNIQIA